VGVGEPAAGRQHRPTVTELYLGEAPLHVPGTQHGHRAQDEVADEDDEVAGLGEQTGGAGGLDGVGQARGVGAEERAEDVGVKWRPEGKCLQEVVDGRVERLEEVAEAFGEPG
jgi:hypothetical protein